MAAHRVFCDMAKTRPRRLPIDATLRSVTPYLKDPVEYVRRILRDMRAYHIVDLELTSNPAHPDYRIRETMYEDDGVEIAGFATMYAATGRNHALMADAIDLDRLDWSCERMTREQVMVLIGDLRSN